MRAAFGVLRSTVEIQTVTRTANGKGGSRAVYATVATVRGEVHAAFRDVVEKNEGDKPTVATQAEFALELGAAQLAPESRLKTTDGRLFEIISLSRQGTVALGRCREVT